MMDKLAARDNKGNNFFKPQVYQSKQGGQSRSFHRSYNHDRGNYQNKFRSNSRDRKTQFNKQGKGRLGYEQNYKRRNFRSNTRSYQDFRRQNSRGEYRGDYRDDRYSRDRCRSKSREDSQETIAIIEGTIEVQAIVDQGQDQEQVQMEIELGVISVGNMIISRKIVLHPKNKEK